MSIPIIGTLSTSPCPNLLFYLKVLHSDQHRAEAIAAIAIPITAGETEQASTARSPQVTATNRERMVQPRKVRVVAIPRRIADSVRGSLADGVAINVFVKSIICPA